MPGRFEDRTLREAGTCLPRRKDHRRLDPLETRLGSATLPCLLFSDGRCQHELSLESDHTDRSSTRGEARYFNVRGGNRLVENSAWHYPQSSILEILGHVRFQWDRMDAWFEEEEEVFVHPHDPYKRIDLLHSSRHIEVLFDGVKLADTRRPTVVYETGAPFATTCRSPTFAWTCLSPPTTARAALTRDLRAIGA